MGQFTEFRDALTGALEGLGQHLNDTEQSLTVQCEDAASKDSDRCTALYAVHDELRALSANLKIAGDDIDDLPPLPRQEVIEQLQFAITSPAPHFIPAGSMDRDEWLSLASSYRQYLLTTEAAP